MPALTTSCLFVLLAWALPRLPATCKATLWFLCSWKQLHVAACGRPVIVCLMDSWGAATSKLTVARLCGVRLLQSTFVLTLFVRFAFDCYFFADQSRAALSAKLSVCKTLPYLARISKS
mmetsp:Transcript_65316/g.164632  ORF Transcript_65316/g.164632 Transcript_65316/m.164632 type:complete len:119 (-) Transcript_65316:125-481(-)